MATVFTTAANLDDSILTALDQAFLLSYQKAIVVDDMVSVGRMVGGRSLDIPKFSKLAKSTTPLNESIDLDGQQLADTKVTFIPAEYGEVVTTTRLSNLQTGGVADLAAAKVTANHMAEMLNALCIDAGESSENLRMGGHKTTEAELTSKDVVTEADMVYIFNRLSRANVPKFADGLYRAILHPDVVEDIKNLAGFTEAQKYADASQLIAGEAGMFKGFRIISTTSSAPKADAGSGTTDTYYSQFFGQGALGMGCSQNPELRLTGPFDKLGRFMHMGWYGVLEYKLMDQDAHWLMISGSAYGDNS